MTSEKKLAKLIDELLEEYMGTKYKRTDDNSLPATTAESPSINDNIEAEMNNRLSKNFFNNKYSDKYNAESAKQLPPGLVWVKNNEIHVQGLPGQNTLPGITPTEDVNLYVNGKQVKNQVFVSEHDYIYVDFNNKEIPLDIKIRISKDGLAAFMSVKLQTLIRYSLQDQQPRQKIVLQTSTSTSKSFPLGLNDILAKIKEAGINYGVDYPAIQKFLAEPRDGEFVIARGVPPTPSRDDTMEVLFPEKIIEHEYSNADRVDFYTFKAVPSVDENTLLAVKHEGEMGQPGLSVTGKAISAREPQKIFPHAGKGVRIENNMVYSTTAGRPMVRRIKTVWLFYVEPYLIHHGNIDLSVGNQNFRGSIKVFGDVRDGMKVRAGGNIHISGTVDRATVMAMDSIWVGKCIGAMVQAGGYSHYISNSYQTLKELHENLESLSMAINILLKHAILKEYKTKLGLIFLLLIEKKFPKIPGLLKSSVHNLEIIPVDMPAEITTLVGMIKEHIPPRNLTVEKIQLLMEYIKLAQEFFLQLQNVSADVYVDYSFNSIIAATNNVYIADKGCFNSKITAGGNIYINGIIRGGEVNAKGNILVKEAGSETGSKTILQTSSGKIKIFNKIYDGVVVYINNRLLKITGTMGPVIFSNDDGEQVQIKYL